MNSLSALPHRLLNRLGRRALLPGYARQSGITTLLVAILLLVILTISVLFSLNVGVFEQKTATNENRAKLASQAAESLLNLAAEFTKQNSGRLVSTDSATGGWLGSTTARWQPCSVTAPANQIDPCLSAPEVRRARMYRYLSAGSTSMDFGTTFPGTATDTTVNNVGSTVAANSFTTAPPVVTAALCRLDTSVPAAPFRCSLNPRSSRLYSVTLVATSRLPGEAASAEVRETLGTYRTIGGAANVPLIASGFVQGLGAASIVTSSNAGGFGVPASIWSPNDVDVEATSGGGVGSFATCQLQEYLSRGSTPEANLFTACLANNACACPNDLNVGGSLSGHLGGQGRREHFDVLDIDANRGTLPDITFFPSHRTQVIGGTARQIDIQADVYDDSLFEWIFHKDVVDGTAAPTATQPNVRTNCGPANNEDCAVVEMRTIAKRSAPMACGSIPNPAIGTLWIEAGCGLPARLGSPSRPVVVVVENDVSLTNSVIFGMLVVRSSTNTATMRGAGNSKIFGSAVVEGSVNLAGTIDLIYSQKIIDRIDQSEDFTEFGKVPGSWLDAREAF